MLAAPHPCGRSATPAGKEFTIRADVRDPDGDPVTYKIFLSGNYASGDKGLVEARWRSTGIGTFAVAATGRPGPAPARTLRTGRERREGRPDRT